MSSRILNAPPGYYRGILAAKFSLTPLCDTDKPDWMSFFSDYGALVFPADFPVQSPQKATDLWFQKQYQRYENKRYGLLGLRNKEGSLIGQVGLLSQQVDDSNELEIGYHLLAPYRGKGCAKKAAQALVEYAQKAVGVASVISCIDPSNAPSKQVAKANGFIFEKQALLHELPVEIWRKVF